MPGKRLGSGDPGGSRMLSKHISRRMRLEYYPACFGFQHFPVSLRTMCEFTPSKLPERSFNDYRAIGSNTHFAYGLTSAFRYFLFLLPDLRWAKRPVLVPLPLHPPPTFPL
jgi:hypothetical protein